MKSHPYDIETLKIIELNTRGRGVANTPHTSIEIPFALPGDEVIFNNITKKVDKIIQKSQIRQEVFCRYFTQCGGCTVQHLIKNEYQKWRINSLIKNFSLAGIILQPSDIINSFTSQKNSRRRASISYRNRKGTLVLGFNEIDRGWIVDIESCPLLTEQINSCIPFLKRILESFIPNGSFGHVDITEVYNGLDLFLHVSPRNKANIFFQKNFIDCIKLEAETQSITKVSCSKGIIFCKKEPILQFGNHKINFLSGGFLQASKQSEEAMISFIKAHIKMERQLKILDLFSGQGSISIPVAEDGHFVTACDINKKALNILDDFSKKTYLKIATCHCRDLFCNPFSPDELSLFDVVILDPPRAGAEKQILQLCNSNISTIFYISCNIKTLASDSALLLNSNFKLQNIAIFDQFPYTEHLEVVTIFKQI